MSVEEVGFFQDDGIRMAGDLVLPAGPATGSVVVCPGFRGTRRGGSGIELARRLAGALGWAVLLIDYTGFGGSDGPRGRFDPERQVLDVRAAVAYLRTRFPDRPVCIYGNSFGAGMATVAAARDAAVAGLFSLCAFSSGAALMADQRRHWQHVEFREALEADRLERVVTGVSREVDPDSIMVRDPEAMAYMANLIAAGRADRSTIRLADAERLVAFEPIHESAGLQGRPALFVHCQRDYFIPAWHSETLAQAAGAPCVLLPYGHYEIYAGEPQEELLRHAVRFFTDSVST